MHQGAIPGQNEERGSSHWLDFHTYGFQRLHGDVITESTFIIYRVPYANGYPTTMAVAITSSNRIALNTGKIIVNIFIKFCFIDSSLIDKMCIP